MTTEKNFGDLLRRLHTGNFKEAATAIRSLPDFPRNLALPLLKLLLRPESSLLLKLEALGVLAKFISCDPTSAEQSLLSQAFTDKDSEVLRNCLLILQSAPPKFRRHFRSHVSKCLESGEPDLIYEALITLSLFQTQLNGEISGILQELALHPDNKIRRLALAIPQKPSGGV